MSAVDRRTFILGFGSAAAGFPSSSNAQSQPSRVTWVVWEEIPTIIVVSAEDDFRVPAIREAVDFWNAELAQLGSPFRLGTMTHSLRSIAASDLLALKAGTLLHPVKNSMREANGGVIVVLSDGDGSIHSHSLGRRSEKYWSESQAFGNLSPGPVSQAMLLPTSWGTRLD